MRKLNSNQIKRVSGGIVTLNTQGNFVYVNLSSPNDSIVIEHGYGVGGNLLLKGDGKAFINDIYLEIAASQRNVYTPNEYFSISSSQTAEGWSYKITPFS
jgi:hypothetical protein